MSAHLSQLRIADTLLVAARGHDVSPSGELSLGESTIQRVIAAVQYYNEHEIELIRARQLRGAGMLVMSGGYPTMATGNRIVPPPYHLREGELMVRYAIDNLGMSQDSMVSVTSPTTALEVVLRAFEDGHFANTSVLGIVTQETQWKRLCYFAHKITGLALDNIVPIFAPGEKDPQIAQDEAEIMKATRLIYGPARTPNGLRRAERTANFISQTLTALHLREPPAMHYLDIQNS